MRFHLVAETGRICSWPQYSSYRHVRVARQHTQPPRTQKLKPFPKPRPSRYALPPVALPKARQHPQKVPQARQMEGSRWSKWKSRCYEWATKHRYIVKTLAILLSGTTIYCHYSLQRVPITGSGQLDLLPHWITVWMETLEPEQVDELRKELSSCSLGSDHPWMHGASFDIQPPSTGEWT